MTGVPAPKFHPEMMRALLDGRKRCTTRREKLGAIGDWFRVIVPAPASSGCGLPAPETIRFQIKDIRSLPFGVIAAKYYICEGFRTEGEFRTFWVKIHRGNMPVDEELRWLHVLERV